MVFMHPMVILVLYTLVSAFLRLRFWFLYMFFITGGSLYEPHGYCFAIIALITRRTFICSEPRRNDIRNFYTVVLVILIWRHLLVQYIRIFFYVFLVPYLFRQRTGLESKQFWCCQGFNVLKQVIRLNHSFNKSQGQKNCMCFMMYIKTFKRLIIIEECRSTRV